jgi:hypothetical protein
MDDVRILYIRDQRQSRRAEAVVTNDAETGSDQETPDGAALNDGGRTDFLQTTIARLLIKNQAMRFELLAAREKIALLEHTPDAGAGICGALQKERSVKPQSPPPSGEGD